MEEPIWVRVSGFLIVFISVFCLSIALYFQMSKDWFPCALCILQRYFYIFTALAGLGVGLSVVRKRRAHPSRLAPLIAAAFALLGFFIAMYHVWVTFQPEQTCGVGPLQFWLNDLPWASALWIMFEADGLCTESYPLIYGLSLPMWSGVGFILQFILASMAWHASRPISVFKASM